MAGCPILISLASLTFRFSHISSVSNTLILPFVICGVWRSVCAQLFNSGFLKLRWSFIIIASILPVSPMYVRGHSGHSTWYTISHLWASGVFSFGYNRMDWMVLMNVPIVSARFEHTCECLEGVLHARQANINVRPGWCKAAATRYVVIELISP